MEHIYTWTRDENLKTELDLASSFFERFIKHRFSKPAHAPAVGELKHPDLHTIDWLMAHGIDEGEMLARLARQEEMTIMPLTMVHPTGAAEEYVQRLRVRTCITPTTPMPWIPVDRIGPFLVVGHWQPFCTDFSGIPGGLMVRVLLTRADYNRAIAQALRILTNIDGAKETGQRAAWASLPISDGDTMRGLLLDAGVPDDLEALAALERDAALQKLAEDATLTAHINRWLDRVKVVPTVSMMPSIASFELLPREVSLNRPALCFYSAGSTRFVLLPNANDEATLEDEFNQSGSLGYQARIVGVFAEVEEIRRLIESIAGGQTLDLTEGGAAIAKDDVQRTLQIDPAELAQVTQDRLQSLVENPVTLCEWIFYRAILQRASDVHIQPVDAGTLVRLRLNGILMNIGTFPSEVLPALVSTLKQRAALDIANKRFPQDGNFTVVMGRSRHDCRLSTLPCRTEESAVVRLISRGSEAMTLEKLRLSDDEETTLREAVDANSGLILVTGPTGSGKTTTLSAVLRYLNNADWNLVTIEDPVEVHVDGLKQFQVNPKVDLGFAKIFRHVLRHDPDIVLVGEIRDKETADLAIEASNTGHLVLATLHTNGAAETVNRLRGFDLPPDQLGQSLVLLQAQRLVKTLCSCATRRAILELEKKELRSAHRCVPVIPDFVMVRRGCAVCGGTGYRGRRAVMEMIPVTPEFREAVIEGAKVPDLMRIARSYGFNSIFETALRLFAEGVTTLEEARANRVPFAHRVPLTDLIKK